jgi:chaperonin GroES
VDASLSSSIEDHPMSSHYGTTKIENADIEMTENRVLVQPAPEATQTPGGIVLPEAARGKPTRGTIIAVGPGRISEAGALIPMPFEIGQQVVYGTYSGTEIEVDGETVLILKQPDIYCVVRPKED